MKRVYKRKQIIYLVPPLDIYPSGTLQIDPSINMVIDIFVLLIFYLSYARCMVKHNFLFELCKMYGYVLTFYLNYVRCMVKY